MNPIRQFTFDAIGTSWRIDFYEPIAPSFGDALLGEIQTRIHLFDRTYSRFRKDSLIGQASLKAGTYLFPPDAEKLFSLYEDVYHATNGLVTPLIGQVLVEAGYDADYSLVPKTLHHPPRWEEALEFQRPQTLIVKQPIMIDVGAMGKGYLIDIIGELLWQHGLRAFCIDAGGDILFRSPTGEALPIGLEHPEDVTSAIGIAHLSNQSICGSAGNRRVWANFHHIINPETLSSPRHLLAVWTVAKTTILADAMSTALFFQDGHLLREQYDFEYLLLYPDAHVDRTPGFPAELFIAPSPLQPESRSIRS